MNLLSSLLLHRWLPAVAVSFLLCPQVFACTVCDSAEGEAFREAVATGDFWHHLAAVTSPFVVSMAGILLFQWKRPGAGLRV